ncbi:MAG TPA: hypothetical protein VKU02_06785, partial [Gemmataceae bacterium]|nr:hypothetical protein [Gemmataceae bacterium]
MPARPFVWLILLFWFAATGWLFSRDLWPRLRSGQPPPYTIDLADEALQRGPKIPWNISRKDKKIGVMQTWLTYRPSDDTFELNSQAAKLDWGEISFFSVRIRDLSGMYRVTRDGHLREIVAEATILARGLGPLQALAGRVRAHIGGEVTDERFLPHGEVVLNGTSIELPLEPVPVSSQGSI